MSQADSSDKQWSLRTQNCTLVTLFNSKLTEKVLSIYLLSHDHVGLNFIHEFDVTIYITMKAVNELFSVKISIWVV